MISQEAHSLLIRAWHGRLLFQGCLSIIPSTRNRNSKPMLARIFATGQVIRTFLPFSPFFTLFFSSSPLFLPLFPSVSKRAKTAKCAVKQTSRERRGEKWNFQRRRSVETGQMGFRSTQMTGALIAFLLLFSPSPFLFLVGARSCNLQRSNRSLRALSDVIGEFNARPVQNRRRHCFITNNGRDPAFQRFFLCCSYEKRGGIRARGIFPPFFPFLFAVPFFSSHSFK